MNNREMLFAPLGDSAVAVTLGASIDAGSLAAVSELTAVLRAAALPGVTDVVPAYATVSVFYEPARWAGDGGTPYEKICAGIAAAAKKSADSNGRKIPLADVSARRVEIPVCYGGEYGPDLDEVAAHTGLAGSEVIARHRGAEYRVQAIGFSPGFPYLSGLPPELATPRRPTARIAVPAGSVGIGGEQTGVYPLASPGGWRLIGRTPLKLFDPARAAPAWLRVGDIVVFRPVTSAEFSSWK